MYCRGINVRNIDLWKSEASAFKIINGEIYPPFSALQGLGNIAACNIVEARNNKDFTSIEDVQVRCRLSKTIIESLREHGTLEDLPETDQLSLF